MLDMRVCSYEVYLRTVDASVPLLSVLMDVGRSVSIVSGGSGVPDEAEGHSWSSGGALVDICLSFGFGFGFTEDEIEEGMVSCLSDKALDEALEVVWQLSRVWEVM